MTSVLLREQAGWAGHALAGYPACGGDPAEDVESLACTLVVFLRLRGYSNARIAAIFRESILSAQFMLNTDDGIADDEDDDWLS